MTHIYRNDQMPIAALCQAAILRQIIFDVPIQQELAVAMPQNRKDEDADDEFPDSSPALLSMKLIRHFYIPVGDRTLDRWISAGQFPKPDISMGGKVRFWKRESVEAWIDQQRGEKKDDPMKIDGRIRALARHVA